MPGILSGNSSTMRRVSGASSNRPPRRGDCSECKQMRSRGHTHARKPKYCPKHQCTYKYRQSEEMCTTRKKGAELGCLAHTQCKARNCQGLSVDENGIFIEYCVDHICNVVNCDEGRVYDPSRGTYDDLCATHSLQQCKIRGCTKSMLRPGQFCEQHSCSYTGEKPCGGEARPGHGMPFCDQHKCSDPGCQNLRSCNEVDGSLRMNSFCTQHECREKACLEHNVPGKPFCDSHCCTEPDCSSPREHDERMRAMCLPHYQKTIVDEGIREKMAEARPEAERESAARVDRTARAGAEARRQGPQPQRPPRSPPHQRYHEQEGLRPRAGQDFEGRYDDGGRPWRNFPRSGNGW